MANLSIQANVIKMGVERHDFAMQDKSGREMGVNVLYCVEERVYASADDPFATAVKPGTYLTAWVKAHRNGANFGAADQFQRFEIISAGVDAAPGQLAAYEVAAVARRDAWVAQAIEKARGNALISRVNKNRK